MGRRRILTDEGVAKLPAKRMRYAYPDPEMPGHYIRVTPSGDKSFVAVVRDREGKQRWLTIGKLGPYNIKLARKRASEIIRAIREGRGEPDSFDAVAANWRELHCVKKGLRSLHEIDRHLGRMKEAWAGRIFTEIKRGDVIKHLDKIERDHRTRQANYALQVFTTLAKWYAIRNEDYSSPIVPGMRRGDRIERDRILSDDELREVWAQNGQFGAFVKVALLTAQRKDKIATMKWDDLHGNVWTIATEAREKANAGELVLPDQVLHIINAQPRFASNPYVFAGRGDGPINAWTYFKRDFDAKLKNVEPWTIHDLRRTAKSLMSRAGVRPDISERVLGHVIKGVEGVYDRHTYASEKAHAVKALAALIENILRPADLKVHRLRS